MNNRIDEFGIEVGAALRARSGGRGRWCAWLLVLPLVACTGSQTPGLQAGFGFTAVLFAERAQPPHAGSLVLARDDRQGARVVLLEPAAPGGNRIPLLDLPLGDIWGLDLSPDAEQAVAALRATPQDRYHLVLIDLELARRSDGCITPDGDLGPACRRLTFGPADDTQPQFLPDGRIAFLRAAPEGPVDFLGRGRARVPMAVAADGSRVSRLDYGLGHGLGISMLRDGWLHLVRWTSRLGEPVFQVVGVDPSGARVPLMGELVDPLAGLPLDPVEDDSGLRSAACVPAAGTWGGGTLCRLDASLGIWGGLLAAIPMGSGCSPEGRLRDPFPLRDGRFLVGYAKVPDGCLTTADELGTKLPDFGVAVFDAQSGERFPLTNDPRVDELDAYPILERALLDPGVVLPPRPEGSCVGGGVTIEGFVGAEVLGLGAVRIRVVEMLTGAEAPWSMELFGSEPGAACAGDDDGDGQPERFEAPIHGDGSFRLRAPSGLSLSLRVLDSWGATLAVEPLQRGGPDCARWRCAGCHANDGQADGIESSQAYSGAAVGLDGPVALRRDVDFRRDIQPILNRSCALAGCHDTDTASGAYVDLNGRLRGLDLHEAVAGRTSVAYQNLTFVDQRRSDTTGRILQQRFAYVEPGLARSSRLAQKLGVPCRFDCAGAPAWAPWGLGDASRHPEDRGGVLSAEDRQRLVDWIEAGAPFLGRGAQP